MRPCILSISCMYAYPSLWTSTANAETHLLALWWQTGLYQLNTTNGLRGMTIAAQRCMLTSTGKCYQHCTHTANMYHYTWNIISTKCKSKSLDTVVISIHAEELHWLVIHLCTTCYNQTEHLSSGTHLTLPVSTHNFFQICQHLHSLGYMHLPEEAKFSLNLMA